MRRVFLILLHLSCYVQLLSAQVNQSTILQATIDSLKQELTTTQNDTLRLVLANALRYNYFFKNGNFDSALVYSKQVLALAQKLGYRIEEAYGWDLVGDILSFKHDQNTLQTFFNGVKIAEDPKSERKILPQRYLKMMTYWEEDFNNRLVKTSSGFFIILQKP
jgi:uncharacterized membrane protein